MRGRYTSYEAAQAWNAALGLPLNGVGQQHEVVKPCAWYQTIINGYGHSDLLAQDVLAAICAFSSARIVANPSVRGGLAGYIAADAEGWFPFPYDAAMEQLNVPKRGIRDAINRLERLGIIEKRVVMDDLYLCDDGRPYYQSSLYVRIVPDALRNFSHPTAREQV